MSNDEVLEGRPHRTRVPLGIRAREFVRVVPKFRNTTAARSSPLDMASQMGASPGRHEPDFPQHTAIFDCNSRPRAVAYPRNGVARSERAPDSANVAHCATSKILPISRANWRDDRCVVPNLLPLKEKFGTRQSSSLHNLSLARKIEDGQA